MDTAYPKDQQPEEPELDLSSESLAAQVLAEMLATHRRLLAQDASSPPERSLQDQEIPDSFLNSYNNI